MGDNDPILDAPWPPDLHPTWAGFRLRTETILRRHGIWDDMTRLNDLTEADVLGWENAGAATVEDLREKAKAAIAIHRQIDEDKRIVSERAEAVREEAEWRRINDELNQLATEPWTSQVWRRDPRFTNLLPPRWEVRTIRDLALSGTDEEKRILWGIVGNLEDRVAQLARLPLNPAVASYVEAISSQHGVRLNLLLACTGLGGVDPITQTEAAAALGVSDQRMSQVVAQLFRQRDKITPPAGIWMPQVDRAIAAGWPDGYTEAGTAAIRRFLQR